MSVLEHNNRTISNPTSGLGQNSPVPTRRSPMARGGSNSYATLPIPLPQIPNNLSGSSVGSFSYDMEKDPNQTTDIAAENPQVVAEMMKAYDQFWSEARPLMVNESAKMSPTRPYHVWYAEQMKAGGIPDWKPPKL